MAARTLNRLGNARQVAGLKTDGMHADGGGLYLRVQRQGAARSWVLVSTKGGKRVERGLGAFDKITLAEARKRRDEPESVFNPAPAAPTTMTFHAFAKGYVDEHKATFKNPKHIQQWENTLGVGDTGAPSYCDPIHDKPIGEVTTDDVLAILRPLWSRANETASRLRGRIERVLDAAAASGHRDPNLKNPALWKGHLAVILPRRKKKRERKNHAAMAWADVPAFMARLRASNDLSARALELTILSAVRTNMTNGALVREFDFDKALWTIPEGRMKSGIAHIVPLTPRMLAIVRDLCFDRAPGDFVFPGQRAGKPLSQQAMLEKLRGMVPGLTVHGFRSSFRDWAADQTEHPSEVAEFALSHVIGDQAKAAYFRTTMIEKRRRLMADWEAFVGG